MAVLVGELLSCISPKARDLLEFTIIQTSHIWGGHGEGIVLNQTGNFIYDVKMALPGFGEGTNMIEVNSNIFMTT